MIAFKALLAALIGFVSGGSAVGAIDIQEPSGSFKVAISHLAFSNSQVMDTLAPNQTPRKVMTTLFFPINATSCTNTCSFPYMSTPISNITTRQFSKSATSTSPAMDIASMQFRACCVNNRALQPKKYGLVILEPGFGTSRLMYGAIANEIASHGHAVITIDHPYDANIVEYTTTSENTFISNSIPLDPFSPNNAWNDTISKVVQTRVTDIQFVLKSLENQDVADQYFAPHNYIKSFASGFDMSKIGIVGHGLGGTVATRMAILDPKFRVSINMDGSPPPLSSDTTAPIVFFGRKDHRREHDELWKRAWPHLKGEKATEFDMKNGGVFDYSDLPLIANLMGRDKSSLFKGLGTIKDRRGWEIAGSFAAAYCTMEWSKNDFKGSDLSALVRKYPEMVPYPGVEGTE